jgi:MFS family permease
MTDHPFEWASRKFQRPTLPIPIAFWLTAVTSFLLLFASTAPAPLYRVYQAQWRFSETALTGVFAVYALALLVTLLFFGSLSDHLGRRRLIVAGLVLELLACALFLVARGVGPLFAARAVQGVAVGLTSSAIGAALIELRADGLAPLVTTSAPTLGLAVGGLATSALVQYGPAPTHLVWWLLLGVFALAIIAVLAMPEPGTVRPGVRAALRPIISVPRETRGAFAAAVPCLIAVWALGGFYLSLGPSLAAQLLRSQNLLWGGVMIFLLTGVGAGASVLVRKISPSVVMLGACFALTAGAAVTLVSIANETPALLLVGTTIAGLGWGSGFTGSYRTVISLTPPTSRAGVISAIFVLSYVSFSVPVVIAGVAASHYGLRDTSLVFAAGVATLSAAAAGILLVRRGRAARGPKPATTYPAPAPCPDTVPPSSHA